MSVSDHNCTFPGHDEPVPAEAWCELCGEYYCDEHLAPAFDAVTLIAREKVCPFCRDRSAFFLRVEEENTELRKVVDVARQVMGILAKKDKDPLDLIGAAHGMLAGRFNLFDAWRDKHKEDQHED